MTWIKLSLRPDDPRIGRLAELCGVDEGAVFRAVVRWFFWLDENCPGDDISISPSIFRSAVRWADDSLARAMHDPDIDWLTTDAGGRLHPTRPDSHFSKSAKQRALTQKRVKRSRNDPVTVERYTSVTRGEEIREEEIDHCGEAPLAPTRRKPPVGADDGWWGSSNGIQFNPKTREWRGITEADRKGWSESCPAVSLVAELARAGAWIVANPSKGRKSNYRRFLNGWLDRCQERGGSHGNGNGFGIPRNGASARRESRRADEFPEQIVLPLS